MKGRAKRAAACASACGRRGGGRRGGDRYLLALEVEAREVAVDEVIPGGARALGVGARVPRRRANDQAVERRNARAVEVADVNSLKASGSRDVAGHVLGVAGGGRVDEADGHLGRRGASDRGAHRARRDAEARGERERGESERVVEHEYDDRGR